MEVRLKRTFVYNGRRYRRGIVDLPADVVLPKGAEILDPVEAKRRGANAAKTEAESAKERSAEAKDAAAKAADEAKASEKAAKDAAAEAEAEAKAEEERKAKEAKKTYAERSKQATLNL